jgi:type I restriction enzyme S subunit
VKTFALADVCTVIMGQAPKGDTYNDAGEGLPLIAGAGDFEGVHPSAKKHTTAKNVRACAPGDVIIGIRASIGARVMADSVYCLGRGVAGLRAGPSLDPRYLWHWSAHAAPTLAAKGRGATFLQVNKNDIAELEIPLPPIEEQRRIASILDAADALRSKRRQAHATHARLIMSLACEMYSEHPLTEPLSGFITFLTSGARGWAKHYVDAGSRFVRSTDVRMNSVSDRDAVFVDPPETAESKRIRVQTDDVLLTITGSRIGRAAEASPQLAGAYISQHVAIIRVDSSKLIPAYLSLWLCHPSFGQRQIASKQYGQTKPGLNFNQIRSFELPVPSISSQQKLLDSIQQLRKSQLLGERGSRRLDSLFASLQQRAFRGEL